MWLSRLRSLPPAVWALALLYCGASLLHFAHNAEYIAFYPNMPAWITRETVYWVWLAITGVGALGAALALCGRRVAAALCLMAYGAFGFDGLGHYWLALCSQHTFAMNFSILFEVCAGATLIGACAWALRHGPTRSACA